MANKVYTIQIKDENLKTSVKSKSVKTKKTASEKEVETFGIVEINNASSKGKMKNTADVGFEKNVTSCAKKAIKSQVSKVDDYFDFSFRTEEKPVKSVAKKAAVETKAKTAKKSTAKAKKVETKQTAQVSVLKLDEAKIERGYSVVAEACERLSDDDAARIISVARVGLLFDCDKCAINSCY